MTADARASITEIRARVAKLDCAADAIIAAVVELRRTVGLTSGQRGEVPRRSNRLQLHQEATM